MTELIEVKVSEISGAALNWAVAMAEGYRSDLEQEEGDGQTVISPEGIYTSISKRGAADGFGYRPSTDWSQGGPLIEKIAIKISPASSWLGGNPEYWLAEPFTGYACKMNGPTPLIAACRAIVASVLGPVVSVPKELV